MSEAKVEGAQRNATQREAILRADEGGNPMNVATMPNAHADSLSPPRPISVSPHRASMGYHVVRIVLALVLLTAAGFKGYALWIDPLPTLSLFSSPRWQVFFIEVETLLALWLLTGFLHRGAWLASVGVFSSLGIVSFYLGLHGHPSCSCFGRVQINPWYTFVLDASAVCALWAWQPRPICPMAFVSSLSIRSLRFILCLGLSAVALLLTLLVLSRPSSSHSDLLAYVRGEFLTIDPLIADVGTGTSGEIRTFEIRIRNHTDRPIRIIGGTADQVCDTTLDLPLSVPTRDNVTIRGRIVFRGSERAFQKVFVLYTDHEKQPGVIGRVGGFTADSPGR